MLEQITEAVVLRTLAYGESDKIVTFATRDFGRLSGIAKGAKRSRRRFPNALETFCHIRLYFRPSRTGGLALVLRCDLIDSHSGIAMDLKALALASFFAEIVDSTLQEGQEAIRVFSLLEWALRWLESRGSSLEILPYFELQWLGATGLQPELRFCLRSFLGSSRGDRLPCLLFRA
jgi:DNA repair protein RecO (recombination protein O)